MLLIPPCFPWPLFASSACLVLDLIHRVRMQAELVGKFTQVDAQFK